MKLQYIHISHSFASTSFDLWVTDTDKEIKTQIVQNCSSHKLRMKALKSPDLTITQLLDSEKALEMSKTQAQKIKDNENVNRMAMKGNPKPSK